MNYNKVCNVQDFAALQSLFAFFFPHVGDSLQYRKYWEVTMALRGIKFATRNVDLPKFLGVGAGYEASIFALTSCGEVHATDIYLTPGWDDYAPADFLKNPDKYAPYPYERQRLICQHMDARDLRYPDNYFDGVFSSSSLEHFGTLEEVSQAMREMARVVKPGGIIAITTEFSINGKCGCFNGNTWIFDLPTLQKYVIAPTGCELLDELDLTVTEETRATQISLGEVMALAAAKKTVPAPHIVMEYLGFVFLPISLVMRKPL